MKLSVIIPMYNAERYIGKCLDSVLACDLDKSEYEVIVIDDGSEDNGLCVVREYASKYENVRSFHQENQGQSVARNYGIKLAKGEYVWFVDADDYVDATQISSALDKMKQRDLDICRFEMLVFRSDGTSYLTNTENIEYDKIYRGEQLLMDEVPISSVCNNIFSRDFILHNNLAFYPGIVRQDTEFSIRAVALVERMMYLDQHIYYYRYNEDSCTRSKNFDKKLKAHIGEAVVARNIREFARRTDELSIELKKYLDCYSTSMVKGRLISYLMTKDVDSIRLYRAFVDKASVLEEYPIKVESARLKDRLLLSLLNDNLFMLNLIKFRNKVR